MTKSELKEMVEMLIKVTKYGRLDWREIDANTYVAEINRCGVKLRDSYDFTIDDYYYTIYLLNANDVVFAEYSFSQTTDNEYYKLLDSLHTVIRNDIYRISESENMIMSTLKDISKEIDNLPF